MSKLHDIVFLAVALWLTAMLATSARAQVCAASISDMNFGVVDTLSEENNDSTAILTLNCHGESGKVIFVCASLYAGSGSYTNSERWMTGSGTSRLRYQLYSEATRSVPWGGASFMWPPLFLSVVLGSDGTKSETFTIYGRVFGKQLEVETGDYSSYFEPGQTMISYFYSHLNEGCLLSLQPRLQSAFTIRAGVQSECSISADDIGFGSTGVLNKNVDAVGRLSIACTPGTSYNIALGDGNNGTGPTQRKMALGDQRVTYGLYRDAARMQLWGNTVQDSVTGTGSGTTQSLNVYGRVPTQSTPSPGTYTDTVVVTVTY